MTKERTELLLGVEIMAVCMKHCKTVKEITRAIYKNEADKNMFRVFQCVEILLQHEVLKPMMNNNTLRFKFNDGLLK